MPRPIPSKRKRRQDGDPRIRGRDARGLGPVGWGLAIVILAAVGGYLAYTKRLPFTDRGYEIEATFENAATLQPNSPVRIAGVNVGKVVSVARDGELARAKFTVSDDALPVHADATVEVRPRLFLEGNFFLDVKPGSPSARELPDGGDIPVTQTATAVQLDEVLSALREDVRGNLRKLLAGYGTALTHRPTAAEDADQDPDVQGETAAEAINDSFAYGGRAGRETAIASDALLGRGPHDLSSLIAAQRRLFSRLSGVESELQGLITNLNVTTGALAAESGNVRSSLAELAPTLEDARPRLAELSDALPPLRALAIELEPSVRELPATITAATPWLDQTLLLLRRRELGGVAASLAATTPAVARTAHASIGLFRQTGLLSRCVTDVLEPAGNVVVNDGFSTGESNFKDFFYGLVEQAGESQGFDGNGQYLRFQSGGGPQLSSAVNPPGGFQNTKVFANTIEAPAGVQPALPSVAPPFKTNVPCYRNDPPGVNGPAAAVGAPNPVPVP